jgi:glycerol-3-phosphate dehydrogenase
VTIELLSEIADVLASTLGWTADEREAEIEATLDVLRTSHGVEVGSQHVPSGSPVATSPAA